MSTAQRRNPPAQTVLQDFPSNDFTAHVKGDIDKLIKQMDDIKKANLRYDGAGDVHLGIIVTHGYYNENKKPKDTPESQKNVRDNIYQLLDGRKGAQLLFSSWEPPDNNCWAKDKCKFISIATIAISKNINFKPPP